jgi:hypothetical protein
MARRPANDVAAATLGRHESRLYPVAAAAGMGLGLFSVLADGILPGRPFVLLGNMAAPWGLVAFFVGRVTTSTRRGATAGGVTLVIGVGAYYLGTAVRGYVFGSQTIAWTIVALVAGPVMGLCGAATAARPSRPPIAAVVVPSAMLLAEALFQVDSFKAWRWNLVAEPYRLEDLAVVLALAAGGFVLPRLLLRDAHDRHLAYLLVPAAGVVGGLGLVVLQRLILAVV